MYICLYCYLTTSGVYRQRQFWVSELQPVAVDNVPLLMLGAVLGFFFFSPLQNPLASPSGHLKTVDVSFKLCVSLILAFLLKSWCPLLAIALLSKEETGSSPFLTERFGFNITSL